MRSTLWLLLAAFTALGLTSVQARPRDDAMSGAFRCAAIADTRQWLDCYYGAAQPVRAQLGLPPAPANQISLAAAPPAGGTAADMSIRDAVMAGAFRCNNFADDRPWLDCYYAASQPVRAELGLTPIPQGRAPLPRDQAQVAAAAPMAPPAPPANSPARSGGWLSGMFDSGKKVPENQFGQASASASNASPLPVDHLMSRFTAYKFDGYGMFTVTLANGQQWRQISGDTQNAHWKKPPASYVAKISHGAFGSYNFQVQGLPGLYKVDRVN